MNDKLTVKQNMPEVAALAIIQSVLAMRQDFERRCLEHFQAKRAAGVKIIDDNGSPATADALFWKNPDGSYGVAAFNVAWIAYRWGLEAGKPTRGDDYKAWYDEAMCASNEAGFVGASAADTIRELARELSELKNETP